MPPPPLPPKHPKSIGSKLAATFSNSRLWKLSQPEPARQSASYESGSSSGSWPRSTTPRPSQPPLITLFMRPPPLSPQDSAVTPSPTPPPISRPPKSDPPIYPGQGQTPASAIAAAHRQATSDGDDRSPSSSSRKISDSDISHEGTPGPSGAQESPWATPDGEKGRLPSFQRHPSAVTRSVQCSKKVDSPSIRSRMKPPSNPIRSRPPSMPLPRTPTLSAPPPVVPLPLLPQISYTELEATSTQKLIARHRAHTILVGGNSPLPADQPTPNTRAISSPPSMDISGVYLDIDTASASQLRVALRTRNQHFEDYVLKATETHVTEVTKLEKKVLTLEKEVARKDKELKGLRWIINNGDSSASLEITYNFRSTGSTRRTPKMPPGLGAEKIPEMPSKWTSLSSVSPSSSSSTSSLLPPSPSITVSSLSAIPE
jgi:hypothetical protein